MKFSDELPFAKCQGACFFLGGRPQISTVHSPACAAGLKGFQLCSNVGVIIGHQPKECTSSFMGNPSKLPYSCIV